MGSPGYGFLARRPRLLIALIVLGVALAGCGGNGNAEPASIEPDSMSQQASPTDARSPDPTFEAASPTPSLTRRAATPAATPVTETFIDNATPALKPASDSPPAGGAELRIDGQPVLRVIAGDLTGRTLYAVTATSIYRSNNGAVAWEETEQHESILRAETSIVIALNEPNVLYTGGRAGCGRGVAPATFARSADAARSWETVPANQGLEPLLAYEAPHSAYLFASDCGLSVSNDGGDTWQRIPDLSGEEIFAVVTDTDAPMRQILVVGVTEGGTGRLFALNTHDPLQPDLLGAVAQFWGDAAVDWHAGRIILATSHQVGISDDGGQNWQWSRDGLERATFSADPLVADIREHELDPFRGFSVARVDRGEPDRIWVAGVHGAFMSVDGGATWTRVGDDVAVSSLVISAFAARVFVSTEHGTRVWTLTGE